MNLGKHTYMDSETYYQTLMEIFPNVILVFGLNGVILDANVKAAELFRTPDDISLKGQNLYNLIVPEDNEQVIANMGDVILYKELHDFELRLQRHDGTVFWGSLTAKLIPSPIEFPATILALIRDITEKKITNEKLRTLAVTDDLTGLFNRRGYTIAVEQEIKHAYRRKEGLILLFFDIDNLKMINTTFGHAEGDAALVKAAQVLRNTFRESDIVARWGGDEFVVLALDVPKGRIPSLLKRLDTAILQKNENQAISYVITFSRGIAYYDPSVPCNLVDMEKLADEMMYNEKNKKHLLLLNAPEK